MTGEKPLPLSGTLKVLIPLYATYAIFAICVFFVFIPQQEKQITDQKKNTIRHLTDNAVSLLSEFDSRIKNGDISPENARTAAANQIRSLRYGPEGKDYFWIIDMHPFMIVHPYRPDLEGRDLTLFRDPAGSYPFIAMVETVLEKGSGYLNYHWQWKDAPHKIEPKTSYVRGFSAWGWIVGTGIYMDDVQKELTVITREFIRIFMAVLIFIILLSVYIAWQVVRIEQKKNQAEEAKALDELRLKKLWDLTQMSQEAIPTLTGFALEEAISLTRSDIGYLAFLNEDASFLTMHTWSKKTMRECDIENKELVYDVAHAGLWAEAARSRETVIINDYETFSSPLKKGCPQGHVPIFRVLNVPVFDGDRLVALAGVGNKKEDYNDSDVRQLKLLMDGMHKILQRKKAEDDLKESEKRYRLLADNATDTIWILELSDFTYSYVSPSMKYLTGYEPEDLEQLSLDTHLSPQTIEHVKTVIAQELERESTGNAGFSGPPKILEIELIRKDGTLIQAEVTARFLKDENGVPARILGISRDITQRKTLEKRLVDTNTDLKMAQRIAGIGNWSLAPGEVVPVWSDEVYRIYERDRSLGPFSLSEYPSVFQGKWLELFKTSIEGAITRGIPYDVECRLDLPSGKTKWVNAICEPQPAEDGKGYFLRGTIQDITVRKSMENRIQQVQKMEALGTLAGGIAHDFNNILSSILGFTELAKIGASGDERILENLDQVLTAGLRARELVKHIVTFSRRADVQKDPTPLAPLLKESLNFLKASMPPTIEIKTRFLDRDCRVLADPTQMHQVFMNLFTNAVHAMKDSGGVLTVKLDRIELAPGDRMQSSELADGHYARVMISDTGCGIPRQVIHKIFEPFFTTKNRGEGTGMGLSVAYGIVREMKGHISVYSEEGTGTTFQLLLPTAEAGDDRSTGDSPFEAIQKGRGKLLIVDDETTIVNWTSQILSGAGYDVTGMTDSRKALTAFRENPKAFDLVLTDLTMPGITGIDLAEGIRKERDDIPIVMCTGFSDGLTPETAHRYGIRDILMKPMIAGELSQVIKKALSRAEKD